MPAVLPWETLGNRGNCCEDATACRVVTWQTRGNADSRTEDAQLANRSIAPSRSLIASGLFILIATLPPSEVETTAGWSLCLVCGDRGVADALLNVLLFIPLGFSLRRMGWPLLRAVLAAFALSAFVEAAQLFIPGRHPNVSDLIFNTIGGATGFFAGPKLAQWYHAARHRPTIASAVFSCGVALVIVATALLMRRVEASENVRASWAAHLDEFATFEGSITSRSATPNHVPLQVAFIRRAVAHVAAPLYYAVDHKEREVFLLALHHDDFIIRYRTRATALGLARAHFRLERVIATVPLAETATVSIDEKNGLFCFRVMQSRCKWVGPSAGSGWAILFNAGGLFRQERAGLDFAWLALLLIPVGFWWRPTLRSSAISSIPVVAMALLGPAAGLLPTSMHEYGGAAAGLLLGVLINLAITSRNASTIRHQSG